MSKRSEELSAAYTDARLEILRPDIAADNYTRGRKMSLDIFDGNEVESAYEAGYEQAEKDLALTLAQVVKLDNIIMNMVGEGYNDGYKTRPFYEEALRRFNEQRKK